VAACALLAALIPMLAHSQELDSVVVAWTSTGDDGRTGSGSEYDLRVSEAPITAANFSEAAAVPGMPAPAPSGTRQRVTVRGLTRGTVYWFAIRIADDAGNWSPISNVVRWNWIIDTAPPAAPQGLTVSRESGGLRITWTPNTEPDFSGYRVFRWLTNPPDNQFTAVFTDVGNVTEYVDLTVPAGSDVVWYRVSAIDQAGNFSAMSAAVAPPPVTPNTVVTVEAPYPNPARGSDPVAIPVVTPAGVSGPAIVDVVNGGGLRVRRLEVTLAPGRQEVVWDGKNDAGRQVVPGAYKAWLIAGATRTSIRLLRVP
jgi:hypothetical protein